VVVDKAFVCLCEDVTLDELRKVIRRGYTDIEEVKRITGIGTGPCQGKQCLHTLRAVLAQETGRALDDIPLTTGRPPVSPVPFGLLAAEAQEEGDR